MRTPRAALPLVRAGLVVGGVAALAACTSGSAADGPEVGGGTATARPDDPSAHTPVASAGGDALESDGGTGEAPAPDAGGEPSDGSVTGDRSTSAVLVSAAADEAAQVVAMSGYVDGVVVEGETCTYRLTASGSSESVEVSTTSVADATSTSCPWGELPLASLHAGTWSAQLHFPVTGAVSAPVTVVVP